MTNTGTLSFVHGCPFLDDALVGVFETAFAHSEGADEGALIAGLVRDILKTTAPNDLHIFIAIVAGAPVGAISFTRLVYDADPRTVFILSPVAVLPGHQRTGIGQAVISFGLETLRGMGCDVAMTYGSPDYYAKTGFQPISQDAAAAPFALKYPHGWLAQSLTDAPMGSLIGAARCVPAFDNPEYW